MFYLEKHGFGEIMQMLHHHLHGDLLHDFTKKHDVSPSKNRDFNLRHGDVIMLKNMFFSGTEGLIEWSWNRLCVWLFFFKGVSWSISLVHIVSMIWFCPKYFFSERPWIMVNKKHDQEMEWTTLILFFQRNCNIQKTHQQRNSGWNHCNCNTRGRSTGTTANPMVEDHSTGNLGSFSKKI